MTLRTMAATQVAEIARRAPVLVAPATALGRVVQQMAGAGRGSAIVVDAGGAAIGIFTQRDLVMRVDLADPAWRDTPVADVMSTTLYTVDGDTSLAACLTSMQQHGARSLPICSDGRPVGVISVRDILRHLAECFPDEFLNLPPDSSLESQALWGG